MDKIDVRQAGNFIIQTIVVLISLDYSITNTYPVKMTYTIKHNTHESTYEGIWFPTNQKN